MEVILSGGDPLMLSPGRLAELIKALDAIPHVAALRIHTRLPVADPAALSPARIAALAAGKPVFVVFHCNHPREITDEVRRAARRLAKAGVALLAQSVLLRGVNNSAETLAALFRALLAAGIKPYYLHHPDLAPGTAHFRVSIAEGRELMRALRGRVSGLALPTYVLDIPGGAGKVPIGPDYLSRGKEGNWMVEDPWGRRHSNVGQPEAALGATAD
jgi:lysine 2,3-aminomutase